MSPILAHVRKDAAALRPLLIAWAVCTGLTLLGLLGNRSSTVTATGAGGGGSFAFSGGFALFLQVLFLVLLIARVVHEDPLAETADVFWRTRPISRPQLLAAKALFIGALTLATLAVILPATKALSFFSPMLWIALLGLVAFASVTPNFTRLLALAMGVGIGVSFLSKVLLVAVLGHAGPPLLPGGLLPHGAALAEALLAVGYLGVIVHQYFTLRWKVSFALLCLTCLLPSLLGTLLAFAR